MWGVTPESTGKGNNVRIVFGTLINCIYHTILQKGKHLSWVPAPRLLSRKPPTVSVQSHVVLAWVFSRLGDHYEPTWNNILQKEWHRRKPEALHSIWNLNRFDMAFHHELIFSSFFFPSTPKLCQRTRRSLLCSSDSLRGSAGGLQTSEKLHNMPKKMARLFPKCHVSLNKSQQWFSLWWLLIAAEGKHSPGVHLHFNMPPTSSSLLLLRIY